MPVPKVSVLERVDCTNNDDIALVETVETEITNRIGANINKRINTLDGASWSVAE